jgi:hypothetical protein
MTLVITDVDVTRPPVVGRLMAEAGILIPASPAHSGTVVEWSTAIAGRTPKVAPANRTMVASTTRRLADVLPMPASSWALVTVLPFQP